jgi:hypothetical protein
MTKKEQMAEQHKTNEIVRSNDLQNLSSGHDVRIRDILITYEGSLDNLTAYLKKDEEPKGGSKMPENSELKEYAS